MSEIKYTSLDTLKEHNVRYTHGLPAAFRDTVTDLCAYSPVGHIVFAYHKQSTAMGRPLAVSRIGAVMLGAFDKAKGSSFHEGIAIEELCKIQ